MLSSELIHLCFRLLNRTTEGKFRLVYYAAERSRPLRHPDSVFKFEKEDTGALPDECAFNLINDASVDDLNKHLDGNKVSWRNFRPNFLVVGAHPYDEDYWKFIKIGEVVFEVLKPCTRCVLTTIDPETGIRDVKTEPLTTLKRWTDDLVRFTDHRWLQMDRDRASWKSRRRLGELDISNSER
ncbi:Mitochondrial amidoxime-reducing component 1 [Eumeta japonica]|uniref:Mitochondrial amidoxime-reducing component 1 n=1 Tax=Eumeta variegata TaxID=151549 RepID=A0A4C1Z075_EUMVA|nr:Mitochondrial amidoxime-reducing component 1 [Eumeta japonica]